MTFSIRICALVMAFSFCLSRKGLLRSPPGASKAPSGFQGSEQLLNLSKRNCFPLEHAKYVILDSSLCDCDSLFPLPVEEKAISWTWCAFAMAFRPFLSRKRQSWEHGVCLRFPFPLACRGNDNHGNTPCACETLFPLPVDEKAILDNTPDKRACDGRFPLPVKGKAIPSHRAPRSPTEPFRALRSPMCTPATEPCGVPRESFSSTGRGKSES